LLLFGSSCIKFLTGGYFPVMVGAALVTVMLTWQWGRAQLAKAFYDFGVRGGKRIEWLVALREMVDEINVSIAENLPHARMLVQGRRRLVESDRAFVFLVSRPIRSVEEYVPVTMRIFLKKYGVLPAHVTFFHARQLSVAEAKLVNRFEVVDLGRNIVSVTGTYGYMEQPDIRGALRVLQQRGEVNIPSERWIIEVGEEEILVDNNLPPLTWLKAVFFRFILDISTPAHRFLGLGYDAGVSKEIIPVVFSREGVEVTLPELEISEPSATLKPAAL
jgi:KUP system potassium uptake protein